MRAREKGREGEDERQRREGRMREKGREDERVCVRERGGGRMRE